VKMRFLLDENLSPDIVSAVLRHNLEIDITHVGRAGALPLGTPDPEILRYCEAEQRALVTNNRKSMPSHIADHWRASGHHWGVFTTSRKDLSIGQIAGDLILLWEAAAAEEYFDREEWIPL
jgi:hypothetical protein